MIFDNYLRIQSTLHLERIIEPIPGLKPRRSCVRCFHSRYFKVSVWMQSGLRILVERFTRRGIRTPRASTFSKRASQTNYVILLRRKQRYVCLEHYFRKLQRIISHVYSLVFIIIGDLLILLNTLRAHSLNDTFRICVITTSIIIPFKTVIPSRFHAATIYRQWRQIKHKYSTVLRN